MLAIASVRLWFSSTITITLCPPAAGGAEVVLRLGVGVGLVGVGLGGQVRCLARQLLPRFAPGAAVDAALTETPYTTPPNTSRDTTQADARRFRMPTPQSSFARGIKRRDRTAGVAGPGRHFGGLKTVNLVHGKAGPADRAHHLERDIDANRPTVCPQ
jgi:hypothetical protein